MMYDEILEKLNKDLEILESKSLAALAAQKQDEYDSLEKEKESLQQKIRIREGIVKEQTAVNNQNRKDEHNKIVDERLQYSRKGLTGVNYADEVIEVWQGWNRDKLKFTYDELVKSIHTILKAKKSFTVGNQYNGQLSARIADGITRFVYHYYDREENDFVLEATNLDNIESFMKSLNLISCSSQPEIEHGIGQSLSEAHFQYRGDRIIKDLFQSFADALYKKEDK